MYIVFIVQIAEKIFVCIPVVFLGEVFLRVNSLFFF